jgi:hypothetical protein
MLKVLILPCSSGSAPGAADQLTSPVSYPISKPRQLRGAFMSKRRKFAVEDPQLLELRCL